MQGEDVDVAPGRERAEDLERRGGHAREAEQRDARGQIHEARVGAQPAARAVEPARGIRHAHALAQPAPQLGLPARVGRHAHGLAAHPLDEHRGAVARVAIEERRDVAHAAEPVDDPRLD